MVNKRILLVGGAGYIGGFTADYLTNLGYDVGVYDNLTYENRYLKEVKFYHGDIRDANKLIQISKEYNSIILLAAIVGDPACSVDPELTNEVNHIAIKNFCQRIGRNKHVIFMSTCSVFGAQSDYLNEESEPQPLSTYARTKLLAEKYVRDINGTIFRLGTVYGLGDTYSRIRLDLVVNVLTMKCVYDGKITIFGGEQWRPLICVKDISGYIEESIRKNLRGTYILSEANYTMRTLGEFMSTIFQNVEINYTDIPFEDLRNYKVITTKSEQTFEYIPQYNIRTEVKKMKRIFEENRIMDVGEKTYNNGKLIKYIYGKS